MRLAVALPGLESAALDRRALEATLSALAASGVDVEGFAEHDRLDVGDLGFPVFHYLRLPERNGAAPFDQVLYPLGRDAAPYQAAFWLMVQCPGVVWLFDSVLHHLALGGYGLWGKWTQYRELLTAAYGGIGPAVCHRDLDQNIVRIDLCIFYPNIEITVFEEHAGIHQFILEIR